MRALPLLCALVLTGSAWAQPQPQPQKVDLRPIWKVGQASRYRIVQTEQTVAQMRGLGEPQKSTTQIEAVVAWEVLEVHEAGGGSARMSIESIQFKISDAQGQSRTITADSADEATQSLRQYIAALSGAAVTVTVGPDGQVASVQGHEAVRARAGEIGQKLDEGFFRDIARDLAVLTGGGASVEPSGKWQHTNSSHHPIGQLRQSYTDELRGVEMLAGLPVAIIERRGELSLEPDLSGRPADAPPLELRVTEADYAAQLFFDLSRHELVGSQAQQTLELEVTITTPRGALVQSIREVTRTQVLRISER